MGKYLVEVRVIDTPSEDMQEWVQVAYITDDLDKDDVGKLADTIRERMDTYEKRG